MSEPKATMQIRWSRDFTSRRPIFGPHGGRRESRESRESQESESFFFFFNAGRHVRRQPQPQMWQVLLLAPQLVLDLDCPSKEQAAMPTLCGIWRLEGACACKFSGAGKGADCENMHAAFLRCKRFSAEAGTDFVKFHLNETINMRPSPAQVGA